MQISADRFKSGKAKYLLALFILAFAVHAPSLFGTFVWDDEALIQEDQGMRPQAGVLEVFTPAYWKQNALAAEGRYRPLRALTFMADRQFWQEKPFGYNLTNIVLDLIAAILLFFLAGKLGLAELGAFLAAALFVVHPVHVEAVAWIKNRTELLMAVFSLSFFLLFLRLRSSASGRAVKWLKLSPLYILALFSKESAAALCATVSLYLFIVEEERPLDVLKETLPAWLMSGAFVAFILIFLRSPGAGSGPHLYSSALAMAQYMRLLFFPFGLSAERQLVTGIDFIGPVLMAALAVYFWRKKSRLALFLSLWAIIAVISVSATGLMVSRPIAEQRLYMAVVPVALLGGGVLGGTAPGLWLLLILLPLFSALSYVRSLDWKDPLVFWEKTVRQTPGSARAHSNLGVAYERTGRVYDAVSEYQAAIKLDPSGVEPYLNLGAILFNAGKLGPAEGMYAEAFRKGGVSEAIIGLSRIYLAEGEALKTRKLLEELLREDPSNAAAVNMLGITFMVAGDAAKAGEYYGKALAMDPGFEDAMYNQAVLLQQQGNVPGALAAYERLLKEHPASVNALNNYGILLDMSGRKDEAIAMFKRAVQVSPGYFPAHYNLGNAYLDKGMNLDALSEFVRVLQLDPGHKKAAEKAEKLRKTLGENIKK